MIWFGWGLAAIGAAALGWIAWARANAVKMADKRVEHANKLLDDLEKSLRPDPRAVSK